MADMTASAVPRVQVRSPRADELAGVLTAGRATATSVAPDVVEVVGMPSARIAETALSAGIVLTELTPVHASLEDAYLALTERDTQYKAVTDGRELRRAAA